MKAGKWEGGGNSGLLKIIPIKALLSWYPGKYRAVWAMPLLRLPLLYLSGSFVPRVSRIRGEASCLVFILIDSHV